MLARAPELVGATATMGPWGRRRVAGSRQRQGRRLLAGEGLAVAAATREPGRMRKTTRVPTAQAGLVEAAATRVPGGLTEAEGSSEAAALVKGERPAVEEEEGCRETLGWAPVRWEEWSGEGSAGRCPWGRGEGRSLVRWVP